MSPLRLWRYVNLVFIKLIDCNECLSWYSLVFLGNLLSLMSSFSKSQQLSFETINSCKVHQSTIDEAYSLWFCHPRPSETLLIFAKRHLTKFWSVDIRRVFLTLFLCSFIAADRTLKKSTWSSRFNQNLRKNVLVPYRFSFQYCPFCVNPDGQIFTVILLW